MKKIISVLVVIALAIVLTGCTEKIDGQGSLVGAKKLVSQTSDSSGWTKVLELKNTKVINFSVTSGSWENVLSNLQNGKDLKIIAEGEAWTGYEIPSEKALRSYVCSQVYWKSDKIECPMPAMKDIDIQDVGPIKLVKTSIQKYTDSATDGFLATVYFTELNEGYKWGNQYISESYNPNAITIYIK